MSKSVRNLLVMLRVPDSWFFLRRCSVLLVSHDADHGFRYQEKYYSQLMDSVSFFLKKQGLTCGNFLKPYTLRARELNFNGDMSANYSFLFMDLMAAASGIFGTDRRQRVRRKLRMFMWSTILKRSAAQAVIAIQPEESLCRAAHDLGIKVFDFQHGVITETIPAYRGEYTLLKDKRDLPHGFFCWDHPSADVLRTWTDKKALEVHVVGNPWLALFSQRDTCNQAFWTEEKTDIPGTAYPKRILVTLQWELSSFFPEYFSGTQFLREEIFNLFARTENEVFWYVRLHPIQMQNESIRKQIVKVCSRFKNVNVIWSTGVPLPVALAEVHGHVTWDSSAVIEAAAMGLRSYVMNPGGFALPQDADKSIIFQDAELPYYHYEKAGLVERSPGGKISFESLTRWLNGVRSERKFSEAPEFHTDAVAAALNVGKTS